MTFATRALAWLALGAVLACEDAHPNVKHAAPSVAASAPAPSIDPDSTGDSAKLDAPPKPVAPERRLRQVKVGQALVIDSRGKWASHCRIHRKCSITPQVLPACSANQEAQPWSTLPGRAEHFTDPQVAVKGQLVMAASAFSTAVACAPGQCCNGRSAKMALAGPPYDLELVGLGCGGDESRLCCAMSAAGESVIATGRMRYDGGRLLLDSPELCRVVE